MADRMENECAWIMDTCEGTHVFFTPLTHQCVSTRPSTIPSFLGKLLCISCWTHMTLTWSLSTSLPSGPPPPACSVMEAGSSCQGCLARSLAGLRPGLCQALCKKKVENPQCSTVRCVSGPRLGAAMSPRLPASSQRPPQGFRQTLEEVRAKQMSALNPCLRVVNKS